MLSRPKTQASDRSRYCLFTAYGTASGTLRDLRRTGIPVTQTVPSSMKANVARAQRSFGADDACGGKS